MAMKAYLELIHDVTANPDETMKLEREQQQRKNRISSTDQQQCGAGGYSSTSSSGLSSTSSSSSSSQFTFDEPKRIMRDPSLSPAKSQRRNYFKNQFRQKLKIRQQQMQKQLLLSEEQEEKIND